MVSELDERLTATIDSRLCPPPPPPPPPPLARAALVGVGRVGGEPSVQPPAATKIAAARNQRGVLRSDRDIMVCSPGRGGGAADSVLSLQSESSRQTRHAETSELRAQRRPRRMCARWSARHRAHRNRRRSS